MPHRKLTAAEVRTQLRRSPFNRLLGMKLVGVHADGITLSCRVTKPLRNKSGMLHGGASATLSDAAVGMALIRHLGHGYSITTTDLKISYFLPVTKGRLFARSHLLRVGKTLCVGRVELSDERKRPAGMAVVTFMILSSPK